MDFGFFTIQRKCGSKGDRPIYPTQANSAKTLAPIILATKSPSILKIEVRKTTCISGAVPEAFRNDDVSGIKFLISGREIGSVRGGEETVKTILEPGEYILETSVVGTDRAMVSWKFERETT